MYTGSSAEEYRELPKKQGRQSVKRNRTVKLNVAWLRRNYTQAARSYDLKLKGGGCDNYNSNRKNKQGATSPNYSSNSSAQTETMASNIPRGGNSKQSGTNTQNRKMFNNFLDSLDMASNVKVNTSQQLNNGTFN